MSQSRKGSALEAVVNVIVGFGINFTANAVLFPLFGWHLSGGQNVGLGVIYTAISLVRSFALRRVFNSRTVRAMRAAP
jgi:hypothetical protein